MRFVWFLVILAGILGLGFALGHADSLMWSTPYGDVDLRLQSSESLVGYDGVLKQAIAGIALPVYTDPKGIVTLHLGAGAPWPVGNQSTIQPIVMMGHNLLKEIPGLSQYTNFQANVFGRWATNRGEAGAGIALSYSFAAPAPVVEPPPPVAVSVPVSVAPPPTQVPAPDAEPVINPMPVP